MSPTEYAQSIIRDTYAMRPTTEGTIRYVDASSSLGSLQLELTSSKVYATTLSARDDAADDFLYDTCEALESLQTFAEVA
jgi:hypothetical protein